MTQKTVTCFGAKGENAGSVTCTYTSVEDSYFDRTIPTLIVKKKSSVKVNSFGNFGDVKQNMNVTFCTETTQIALRLLEISRNFSLKEEKVM